jgi:hypothetical protein
MEVAYFEYPIRSKYLRPLVASLALGPAPRSDSSPPMVFCDGDYGRLLSLPTEKGRPRFSREHRASLTQAELPLPPAVRRTAHRRPSELARAWPAETHGLPQA